MERAETSTSSEAALAWRRIRVRQLQRGWSEGDVERIPGLSQRHEEPTERRSGRRHATRRSIDRVSELWLGTALRRVPEAQVPRPASIAATNYPHDEYRRVTADGVLDPPEGPAPGAMLGGNRGSYAPNPAQPHWRSTLIPIICSLLREGLRSGQDVSIVLDTKGKHVSPEKERGRFGPIWWPTAPATGRSYSDAHY